MSNTARFEIIPLGVGNYFSTFRYCTSLVLCIEDQKILVDCPDPFFRICSDATKKSGRELHIKDFDHIILTHLHGDHCNGLEGFGFWKKFVGAKDILPELHTSKIVHEALWNKLKVSMGESVLAERNINDRMTLDDYFDVHPFVIGETFEVLGVKFETRRTLHTIPCFGFRAHYGGRVFGYSCDTIFDPGMIKFLEPCDLIFHECDRGVIHTALDELESKVPAALQKKMRLVHLNDLFPGSDKIEAAEEGRVYSV